MTGPVRAERPERGRDRPGVVVDLAERAHRRSMTDPTSTTDLVAAALAGDGAAWSALIERYQRLVWKSVNMVARSPEDREDAFARTWLRLAESLATVREPERLAGWLAITASREALAVARGNRAQPAPGEDLAGQMEHRRVVGGAARDDRPETNLLDAEAAAAARLAFHQLDEVCRELLTLLILNDPPLSYGEVEQTLGRPHGWIGPTRLRCLDKLRRTPAMRTLAGGPGTGGSAR